MNDHNELLLRNGTAAAAVAVARFYHHKGWIYSLGVGALVYVAMDWAANLRSQS